MRVLTSSLRELTPNAGLIAQTPPQATTVPQASVGSRGDRFESCSSLRHAVPDAEIPRFAENPLNRHWSVWLHGNWRATFRVQCADVELVDYSRRLLKDDADDEEPSSSRPAAPRGMLVPLELQVTDAAERLAVEATAPRSSRSGSIEPNGIMPTAG